MSYKNNTRTDKLAHRQSERQRKNLSDFKEKYYKTDREREIENSFSVTRCKRVGHLFWQLWLKNWLDDLLNFWFKKSKQFESVQMSIRFVQLFFLLYVPRRNSRRSFRYLVPLLYENFRWENSQSKVIFTFYFKCNDLQRQHLTFSKSKRCWNCNKVQPKNNSIEWAAGLLRIFINQINYFGLCGAERKTHSFEIYSLSSCYQLPTSKRKNWYFRHRK